METTICRHRAQVALENHRGSSCTLKESSSLSAALMNPDSTAAQDFFLMKNLGLTPREAKEIFQNHAPKDCPLGKDCLFSANIKLL
jgi:hypothetical protein